MTRGCFQSFASDSSCWHCGAGLRRARAAGSPSRTVLPRMSLAHYSSAPRSPPCGAGLRAGSSRHDCNILGRGDREPCAHRERAAHGGRPRPLGIFEHRIQHAHVRQWPIDRLGFAVLALRPSCRTSSKAIVETRLSTRLRAPEPPRSRGTGSPLQVIAEQTASSSAISTASSRSTTHGASHRRQRSPGIRRIDAGSRRPGWHRGTNRGRRIRTLSTGHVGFGTRSVAEVLRTAMRRFDWSSTVSKAHRQLLSACRREEKA